MYQVIMTIILASLAAAPDARPDGAAPPPPAADFRVENAVFLGEEKEPVCRSATIFHAGAVYDCMKSPAETIVFEPSSGRFVLLNLKDRTRAELTAAAVAKFTEGLQEVAARSPDPLVRFLAAPRFRESADPATGELTLDSPSVVYRLTLAAEREPGVAEQYREFADWYARLNALLSPGSPPPFGRLAVNAALAQRGAIASNVTLTLTCEGKWAGRYPALSRSEHRLVRPLTAADLDRVRETRKQMAAFKPISFADYRKTKLR